MQRGNPEKSNAVSWEKELLLNIYVYPYFMYSSTAKFINIWTNNPISKINAHYFKSIL